MQDLRTKLTDIWGYIYEVPHNGFQEIVVVWGIVGLILFFVMLIAITKNWLNKSCRNNLTIIPMVAILLFSMAGQLITSYSALLALSFSYMCLFSNHEATSTNPVVSCEGVL